MMKTSTQPRSEGVRVLGVCPNGCMFSDGVNPPKPRRLLLRGGRAFCLACGYI